MPINIKRKLEEGAYSTMEKEDAIIVMKLRGINNEDFKSMVANEDLFKKIRFTLFLKDMVFLIQSRTLQWHLLYLFICAISNLHPIIAVLQIFDIAIRSDTIYQISTAISRNSK